MRVHFGGGDGIDVDVNAVLDRPSGSRLRRLHEVLVQSHQQRGVNKADADARALTEIESLVAAAFLDLRQVYVDKKSTSIDRLMALQVESLSFYDDLLRTRSEPDVSRLEVILREMSDHFDELRKPAAKAIEGADNPNSRATAEIERSKGVEPTPLQESQPKQLPHERILLPAGPSMPAPALARLVTPPGSRAAEVLRTSRTHAAVGLRLVQGQNAVPSLEARLTSIAALDEKTGTALLVGLGRHAKTLDVPAIRGIAHFLELGGNPRTLAVVLGLGSEYGAAKVQVALSHFTTLDASDLAGIEAIMSLRGDGRSAMDRIVGIGAGFDEPRSVFRGLGVLSPRTESGLDQLVRQIASPNAGLRVQAYDAMIEGLDIVVKGATHRLRFERQTVGGAPVLSVRDASLTAGRILRSYSPPQLDAIVAQKPPITQIRTLGADMVQGSSGSLFEKWCRRWVFDAQGKGIKVPRLTILQKENGHINLMGAEKRSSDAFVSVEGEVWDMKFLQAGGRVDWVQLTVYKAMQKEGLVVTPDKQRHTVKSINYLFPSRPSAEANAFAADTLRDVRVWYINDDGWLTLLH